MSAKNNLLFFGSLFGLTKLELEDSIQILFDNLNLNEIKHKEFMFLSTGQRKKLMIARALLKQPDIILCDEILSNLDSNSRNEIYDYFSHLKRKEKSIIWVSHSKKEFSEICDRELELNNGKIYESQKA